MVWCYVSGIRSGARPVCVSRSKLAWRQRLVFPSVLHDVVVAKQLAVWTPRLATSLVNEHKNDDHEGGVQPKSHRVVLQQVLHVRH
jgi:hypothetical protein